MVADVAYLQQNQQQIDALEPLLAAQRAAYRANPMPSAEQRRAWLKALRELLLSEKQALIDAVSSDFSNRAANETLLAEIMPSLHGAWPSSRPRPRWYTSHSAWSA
jgi:coniferyl-aldehyde dehydrogenase